jgi:hypothetical protein
MISEKPYRKANSLEGGLVEKTARGIINCTGQSGITAYDGKQQGGKVSVRDDREIS